MSFLELILDRIRIKGVYRRCCDRPTSVQSCSVVEGDKAVLKARLCITPEVRVQYPFRRSYVC